MKIKPSHLILSSLVILFQTSCEILSPAPWNLHKESWDNTQNISMLYTAIDNALQWDQAKYYDTEEMYNIYENGYYFIGHNYKDLDMNAVLAERVEDTLYYSYYFNEYLIEKLSIPLDRIEMFKYVYNEGYHAYYIFCGFRIDSADDRRFWKEY